MSYTVGQRWVSQAEPKLGLGIVSEIESRRISITYPAVGETRTYALDNAPISRVTYKAGDQIFNHEDEAFTVESVDDQQELIQYSVINSEGQSQTLSEVELNCFIQFTSPLQRLMSGHYDRNRAFRLRYETLQHLHRLQQSDVQGLIGSRTSLLPHQLYIADKVANRFAPRVLLADEVGLGKTIEAGMILHAQLHKGLASRVLIAVPPTLVHQWLVEMLRRFNLRFSIFDQERYQSLKEEGLDNPFESEQLVLCDMDFLYQDPDVQQQACQSDWDLLVVDEAHHLHWSEEASSPEYQCVEALSAKSRGVLLLTATPEQAGVASHFARLRLLDPDRFHSLTEFIEQEQGYADISRLVGELQSQQDEKPLSETKIAEIESLLGEDCGIDLQGPSCDVVPAVVQQLLDQHGTGRILFRNTRQSVQGFPKRVLNAHPLGGDGTDDLSSDPRTLWLLDFLSQTDREKVLLICHSAERALALESYLRLRQGIRSCAFHEGLSIVERDRAAAYFADREEGAQVLICSEIGSEGRNFQFAHHLVLFDLPDNPDLLEQRIGRLDRIGQTHDIQIHVPFLEDSEQEGLFYWYHEGLDAFEHSCAAGFALFERFQDELRAYLDQGYYHDDSAQQFIATVRRERDLAMDALKKGRDPLLELNSCNPEVAAQLIEKVEWEEESQTLAGYMDRVYNLYGVNQEQQSDGTVILHPGEHMLTQDFPQLTEEGCTLSYHRLKALVREDVEFVTWEHPMVAEVMEQTVGGELGNAALATMSVKGVPAGTLFLEAIFTLNSMAPKALQLDRYLPLSPKRVVVNLGGRDLSEVLPHDKLNELCSGVKRKMAPAVVREIRDDMPKLLDQAKALVEPELPNLLDSARQHLSAQLDGEIQRLVTLQARNPLIRDEEIESLRERKAQCLNYIDRTGLELRSMRIVINT